MTNSKGVDVMDYNDGNWHGWNGGDCPVHPKTIVDYVSKGGMNRGMPAKILLWEEPDLIFAFCVVEEHKVPREFWLRRRTHAGEYLVVHSEESKVKWSESIHVREVLE